ncbi:hypothetical protein SAG0109_07635 [Streptococcus agalactiae BSU108]|nr:Hypothetical Protein GBS85147_0979 [Streptococcus agalactiae]EPU00572.1 hypothetical protein SAG0109_07635 [Streptococcus agalactiae BSU108]EPW72706.1 hypothetical protein SAG0101_03185 [Streptococcus agalactiae BSU451]EPW91300.1 hypothetical protein SAG0141_00245 [Streptococcus agalactiae MRI Z1-023]ASI66077.1 hypothetical protein GT95_05510 [Streptococcus agalactiae]
MFKGFKKLIIIMGGISLMMILTACDLVKKRSPMGSRTLKILRSWIKSYQRSQPKHSTSYFCSE